MSMHERITSAMHFIYSNIHNYLLGGIPYEI